MRMNTKFLQAVRKMKPVSLAEVKAELAKKRAHSGAVEAYAADVLITEPQPDIRAKTEKTGMK